MLESFYWKYLLPQAIWMNSLKKVKAASVLITDQMRLTITTQKYPCLPASFCVSVSMMQCAVWGYIYPLQGAVICIHNGKPWETYAVVRMLFGTRDTDSQARHLYLRICVPEAAMNEKARTSKYIPLILWNVITFPCTSYLLLSHKSLTIRQTLWILLWITLDYCNHWCCLWGLRCLSFMCAYYRK